CSDIPLVAREQASAAPTEKARPHFLMKNCSKFSKNNEYRYHKSIQTKCHVYFHLSLFFWVSKSIHAGTDDFDHVFGIRREEEFDRVYQRIQLEEQENRRNIARRRPDENNGSGFIAENSGNMGQKEG
ncbi:hypothetical protein L9F63_024197, partial [Diploptera punctata]